MATGTVTTAPRWNWSWACLSHHRPSEHDVNNVAAGEETQDARPSFYFFYFITYQAVSAA